jgi:hypothetical protein
MTGLWEMTSHTVVSAWYGGSGMGARDRDVLVKECYSPMLIVTDPVSSIVMGHNTIQVSI